MGIFQIAGLNVRMEPQEKTLQRNSRAYRQDAEISDADVDMELHITPEKMAELRKIRPQFSADQIEYTYMESLFHYKLLSFEGFFLHASAIAYGGQAYLFSAPSGTGKSTHTQLWRTCFGEENTFILNDDKPVLRFHPKGCFAYGTPFSGKTDLSRNIGLPVRGICFLERGEVNKIAPLPKKDILPQILSQTYRPYNTADMETLLRLAEQLIQTVPFFQMHCNMEKEAAYLAYETMRRGVPMQE